MADRIDPGGYHFIVINISINNTPVFVSYVVAPNNQDSAFLKWI